MGDVYPKVRLAAIQAAPVFLDREASVEKACRLIREAGANGAQVIGFPEGFIPAHPVWYHFHPATSPIAFSFSIELFQNSVEIPSPATEALCQAAHDAGTYVVMGLCERLPGTSSLYNTQLFIDRVGRTLGKHQKLVPTTGERLVHALGQAGTLRAFETEFGPISGLMCGENSNPLAIFALTAQGARIHVASWPHHFRVSTYYGHQMKDVATFVGQSLAYMTKAIVINACGTVDEEMIRVLPATEDDRIFLRDPAATGGSTIIGVGGNILAGPLGSDEGILYADVDLQQTVRGKLTHDFAGHYNRADVFQVNVTTISPRIYNPVVTPPPTLGAWPSEVNDAGMPTRGVATAPGGSEDVGEAPGEMRRPAAGARPG